MIDKIIETTKELIKFESVAENKDQIEACLEYCIDYFSGKNVVVQRFENENISPVLVISNCEGLNFDVMTLGHVDVVPAEADQFKPEIKDGKLYGRGAMDMKGPVAVALNTMDYILENNLDVTFGIVITTDEETTATGASYLAKNTDITAKILLDVDVANDIEEIITKCKNVQIVELYAEGEACHGAFPWEGSDAIEKIIRTFNKLREKIPYYAKGENEPDSQWVDTLHMGKISAGKAANVVAPSAYACLNFRLTEKTPADVFKKMMDDAVEEGVKWEVKMSANPVIIDESNKFFKKYKECVEKHVGKEVKLIQIGGATDSRHINNKGVPVAMHSVSGKGMHSIGEYCVIESMEQLAKIQIDFIDGFKS